MTAATLRRDPGNALNALAAKARATSSAKLVTLETAALALSLLVWIWSPNRWQLALPCLSLASLGLWGVIDHVVVEGGRSMRPPLRVMLRVTQVALATAGTVAAAAAAYLLVGRAIGTVVS